MATGYLLQDYPNPNFGQFGWPRKKVSGVIGVHTAENNTDFLGPDSGAEDVVSWIRRRPDPGGYHSIADADSRLKLVHPRYAAWADTTNNAHAMSVSGAMQAARWRELSPERAAALTRNMAYAAVELVRDAMAAGLLDAPTPARRITPAEAISGSRAGFYGHGETNPGRRYDPGANFDWTLFLQTYASAIGGGLAAAGTTTEEEDDMGHVDSMSEDAMKALAQKFWEFDFTNTNGTPNRPIWILQALPETLAKQVSKVIEGVLRGPVAWFGFDGKVQTGERTTTTLETALGFGDTIASEHTRQISELRAVVNQLALGQGITIDYKAIAKEVVDEEARRLTPPAVQ